MVRLLLQRKKINDSWKSIVKTLQSHMLIIFCFYNDKKQTIEIWKSAYLELWHLRIHEALGISSRPGKITKKSLSALN
jgi:hypothetical protein